MSRTWKDQVRTSFDRHRDAPFWKYRWWTKHGRGRHGSSAATRRMHNRIWRAKAKCALREGREPVAKVPRYLAWIYW